MMSGTPTDLDSLQYFEYHYDAIGDVNWIKDYNAGGTQTQTFGYDALNRLTSAVTSGGTNGTYSESYTYNANTGNLASKTGLGTYTYNSTHQHAVASVSGRTFQYDANGNITQRVIAGSTNNLAYDAENHLSGVSGAATATFVYDGDGNRVASVDEYQNLAAGAPVTSDVTLNNADVATNGDTWANSGTGSDREFASATSGLHYAQVDLGAAYPVDKVIVWHYAADGRTYHGTKVQVSVDGTNWDTVFSSDSTPPSEYPETAAGKTITFSSRQVRYVRDWLNGSTSNAYNHWVEIEVWGKATTAYVGKTFEWHGTTSTMVKYYYAGGQRVAMRQGNGTGVSQLYYLLSDHLGSTAQQVDAVNANPLTDLRYKPWGEPRNGDHQGDTPTDFRFTGQSLDSGLGLYYYGARWYDSMLGRFLSPDSIIPDPGSPSSWDRYSYTFNRPTVLIDPTGHKACDAEFGCSDVAPPKTSHSSQGQALTKEEKKCGGGGCGLEKINKNKSRNKEAGNQDQPNSSFSLMWGWNVSGSNPFNDEYYTVGEEEVILPDDTRATYDYGGQGNSVGVGANATAYIGVVANLDNPEKYTGNFASTGLTISIGEVGITIDYFWNPDNAPLSKGNVQGFSIGYSPGAQVAVWWSVTNYKLTWKSK